MILLQPSSENTIYDRLILTELELLDNLFIYEIITQMSELSARKERNAFMKSMNNSNVTQDENCAKFP